MTRANAVVLKISECQEMRKSVKKCQSEKVLNLRKLGIIQYKVEKNSKNRISISVASVVNA